jgi:hypothetical protein
MLRSRSVSNLVKEPGNFNTLINKTEANVNNNRKVNPKVFSSFSFMDEPKNDYKRGIKYYSLIQRG